MNISRRHLTGPLPVLGLVAVGLLGARAAQALTADEEAVAKRLEAFRSAQFAADAKAFDGLCAAELSYSHSDGHVEDKATFIKNATAGKSKFLSLEYQDPSIRVVGDVAIVRFHWVGESETIADGKKSSTNLHILMNWQKQGGGLETAVPRVHQTLTVANAGWPGAQARPSRRLVTRCATAPACRVPWRHHAVRTPPRRPRRS